MHNFSSVPSDSSAPAPHEIACSEWAIALILSRTTPRDACQLALVSKTFAAASDSDVVWDRMLPSNHRRIVEQADDCSLQFASKKEFYFRLCRSVPLCNGTQRYWLHRPTGGECYMLSSTALTIIWGDDTRYWERLPREGSWFNTIANLNIVWWFEIKGRFRQILQPGAYKLSFRICLVNEYGWRAPIKASLSTSDGQNQESQVSLNDELPANYLPGLTRSVPPRYWCECEVGVFNVEDGKSPIEVNFSIKEIDVRYTKGGLFVDGAILRPTEVDLSINEGIS